MDLALWQASAAENQLELLAAHAVPAVRVSFNPMLGSGGNAGKREFAKGWKAAVDALARPTPATLNGKTRKSQPNETAIANEQREKRHHLQALLLGQPLTWMVEKLNAASWFSEANKLYNSGQRPFREGGISPWSMALACEGLVFFAGGVSRRLGARAKAVGAFPFVTQGAAPRKSGEAGRDLAEVWAPLWHRPMTLPEMRALFARGRAEVRGRGVLTPSAFATAILRRGVDAGITEFRRFTLGRTTSANTFEPRFEGAVRVRSRDVETASDAAAPAAALDHLLALIDRLPRDRKVGERWRFVGLRGPLEAALLDAAAAPADPEAANALLDAAVSVLDRVDRNRAFRERELSWEPLPLSWLPFLFGDEAPCPEARLALALVSGFTGDRPFALYRFGVEPKGGRCFLHPKILPARWCWRPGPLAVALCAVVQRRGLDWEAAHKQEPDAVVVPRVPSPAPVPSTYVDQWLAGLVDDELLSRWLSRLALFDWSWVPPSVKSMATTTDGSHGASGNVCLFGLLQPLIDLRPVGRKGMPSANLLRVESKARTPAAARMLIGLLRVGQVDAAVRFAESRYAMAGSNLMRTGVSWRASDPSRLLASLLFPVFPHERAALVERWLRPRRQGDQANV
jgi:CRISPR-associated protein Csx17